jgi:hypothetical protein
MHKPTSNTAPNQAPNALPVALPRPPSAVATGTGICGILALFLSLMAVTALRLETKLASALVLVSVAVAMLAYEGLIVKPWRAPNAALNFGKHVKQRNWPRIFTKLLGFAVAWALLGAWFTLVPYYGTAYTNLFKALLWLSVGLSAIGSLYVAWIDPFLKDPFDSAWHFGRSVLGIAQLNFNQSTHVDSRSEPELPDWRKAIQFVLGWFIKGFFFVFLLPIVPGHIEFFKREVFNPWESLFRLVFLLTPLMFLVDVVIALVGYACTFKLFDSHIRSPNNRWWGWFAALSCYPPFVLIGGTWVVIQGNNILDWRKGGTYWDLWISHPALQWVWALAVLLCLAMYMWATVAFGIRFSNLTHRGIITHGPYRIFQHPAYVSKNAYWWLIYVPWVNKLSAQQAVINCGLLILISLTYYLRAKTEAAHLSEDPAYRDYVNWHHCTTLWDRIRAK